MAFSSGKKTGGEPPKPAAACPTHGRLANQEPSLGRSLRAALALSDVVVLLPGNPDASSNSGFVIMVGVQVLVIWRLLNRSSLAWFVVVLSSALYAVSFVLLGGPYETTFTITALLSLIQVALLFTPAVLSYVFGEDKAVASH